MREKLKGGPSTRRLEQREKDDIRDREGRRKDRRTSVPKRPEEIEFWSGRLFVIKPLRNDEEGIQVKEAKEEEETEKEERRRRENRR